MYRHKALSPIVVDAVYEDGRRRRVYRSFATFDNELAARVILEMRAVECAEQEQDVCAVIASAPRAYGGATFELYSEDGRTWWGGYYRSAEL